MFVTFVCIAVACFFRFWWLIHLPCLLLITSLRQHVNQSQLRWLYHLRRSELPLPRRQEADHAVFQDGSEEKSASVSHEEGAQWATGQKDAIICSLSRWETREHPDPCHWQLGQLVDCIALYDSAYFSDIWVFYDYTSLYQFERETPEQEDSFCPSLRLDAPHRRPHSQWHLGCCHSRWGLQGPCLSPAEQVGQGTLKHNRTDYDKRGLRKNGRQWNLVLLKVKL